MSEIQNKVVIITGASSGLGAATAERLAASEAKLMLAARREDRLKEMVAAIERLGWTATYLVTDVTDLAQVEALAKETVSIYGRIDVLINSAGVMPLSPLDKVKVKEWDRTIDADAIARAIAYAIEQPGDVDVNEITVSPTRQA